MGVSHQKMAMQVPGECHEIVWQAISKMLCEACRNVRVAKEVGRNRSVPCGTVNEI